MRNLFIGLAVTLGLAIDGCVMFGIMYWFDIETRTAYQVAILILTYKVFAMFVGDYMDKHKEVIQQKAFDFGVRAAQKRNVVTAVPKIVTGVPRMLTEENLIRNQDGIIIGRYCCPYCHSDLFYVDSGLQTVFFHCINEDCWEDAKYGRIRGNDFIYDKQINKITECKNKH